MLEIEGDGRDQHDKQRKREFDFYGHGLILQPVHDMPAHAGPPIFASAARARIWTATSTIRPLLPSRMDGGHTSKSPGANSTTRPATTTRVLHLSSA